MKWHLRLAASLAILATTSTVALAGEALYATSIRSANTGSEISGSLYAVDPATGAATVIGPIRVGNTPIGVVAVASHPKTGAFYGITAGLSPVIPRSLVTIDLATGAATLVARLAAAGSDLAFGHDGTLYMWMPETNRVAKVDLDTGDTTPLGPSGIQGVAGGGIAVDPAGDMALIAATGATGTLDIVDLKTGMGVRGPSLTRAPYADSIDNLTFSPSGVLYAINSNAGAPSNTALVTINTATGVVYKVGALPDDVHGLIFVETDTRFTLSNRAWALIALSVVALVLIAYALLS